MRIKIRLSTETSYTVDIPDKSTVSDLRKAATEACPAEGQIPTDFKLIFNGQKLGNNDDTLESYNLKATETDATVILMSDGDNTSLSESTPNPSTTTKKAKTKKNKCSFQSCNSAPLRMVGTCTHCQGKFCAKHRLLEDHMCKDLQFYKDNEHEKNAMKLQNERTIINKV